MSDIERMKSLVDELNAASEAYYGGEKECLSDHEWDAKFDELTRLEIETGVVLPNSPTHKVSSEAVDSNAKAVSHEFPALSLPKSKDVNALIKWAEGRPVVLSWKLDGMTLVVTYDNGKLTRVVTRHDGITGYDITHLAAAIGNLPRSINHKGHLVVRGEAIITYSDFADVNDNYGQIYENPRNLVAGSLNPYTKSAESIEDRCITWVPFNLVYVEDKSLVSHMARLEFLESLGINTVKSEYVHSPDQDLSFCVDRWSKNVAYCEYPVDGLVIVYDDTDYASKGTIGERYASRGGFAFKWADEEAKTVLTDIEWSVSVNSINPVAVFEPVRLEGTTVSRASLCNISELERLGVGCAGTELTVIKANKIIPKVVKASRPVGVMSYILPHECPICGSKVDVKVSDTGVKTLICTNPDCIAKQYKKLERFVCKYGFNILGLSESIIRKLAEHSLIFSPVDILLLPDREFLVRNVLNNVPGFGDKSITNMLNSIKTARKINADQFLYSLCIPMCGRDMAKKLTAQYTVKELVSLACHDAENNTVSIIVKGVGNIKINEFIRWFSDSDNVSLVNDLLQLCEIQDRAQQACVTDGKCKGLTFVVTGKLQNFASRDDFQKYVEDEGGHLASSVSKNVNYLVNNDIESTSSKNMTAKKLGVPIISEDMFLEKFGS